MTWFVSSKRTTTTTTTNNTHLIDYVSTGTVSVLLGVVINHLTVFVYRIRGSLVVLVSTGSWCWIGSVAGNYGDASLVGWLVVK